MITYADFPLLYDDPDRRLQAWLAAYQPFSALRPCRDTLARSSAVAHHRGREAMGRGLPLPNYPDPPPPRLNVLWWPTGAARWATYFAIVDSETLEKVFAAYRAVARTSSGVVNDIPKLKISDGTTTLETRMHPLAARRVSVGDENDSAATPLWILPLVDDRYFWQWRHADDAFIAGLSPSGAFGAIGGELGVTIDYDAIPVAYGILDKTEMHRPYESAGVLIDAIAHSVGMRFTRKLDGTCKVISWTGGSDERLTENLKSYWQVAGGDSILPPVPEKLVCTFRYLRDGLIQDMDWDHRATPNASEDPMLFTSKYSLSSATGYLSSRGFISGLQKVVHCSWFAVIEFEANERLTPTNETALEGLRDQIGQDFHDSLLHEYDYTMAGLKDWQPTGWEDATEWRVAHLGQNDEYECYTRVVTLPQNFGVEANICQGSGSTYIVWPCDELIVLLNANVEAKTVGNVMGHATGNVWWRTPNVDETSVTIEDTEIAINVFNPFAEEAEASKYATVAAVHGLWVLTQHEDWAKEEVT